MKGLWGVKQWRVLQASALLLLGALFLSYASPVHAAGIVVNSLLDTTVGGDGNCTLREAIDNANSNSDKTAGDCTTGSGADTITFSVSGTISLSSNLLWIVDSLTITGPAEGITIDGGGTYQIFSVMNDPTLNIANLTLAHGFSNFAGGAIYNANNAIVNVTNTTFFGNSESGGLNAGGAISNFAAGTQMNISNSTFINNTAPFGAAIHNFGTISITNSTFTGNSSTSFTGAALQNNGSATIINSTISGNTSPSGAVYRNAGTLTLQNTIVANTTGKNCGGAITNGGGNLQFGGTTANSCGASIPTSDPKLGALAANGGPTQTMPLLSGSPAINAAIPANCPATDQRALNRRSGFCDIGAFEAQVASLTSNAGSSPQSAAINTAFEQPLQINAKDANANVLGGVVVAYSAPGSGASANLSSGTATSAVSGNASVTATANGIPGSYNVMAAASGLTANFSLTNNGSTLYLPLVTR